MPDAPVDADVGSTVRRTVWQTEALAEWMPLGLFLLLWLVPVAFALRGGVGNAVVVGIVMGLVTPFVIRGISVLVLDPVRALRYKKAARLLDGRLHRFAPAFLARQRWQEPNPGVLAITHDRDLIIADRSTGYAFERVPACAIREVTIDRQSTQITNTRHGPRFTMGGGSTFFGAASFGGRSRSVSRSIETVTLELRFRHPITAPMRTAFIGFGLNRSGAADLRVVLLEVASPPTPQDSVRP